MNKNICVSCENCCFGSACQKHLFDAQEPLYIRSLTRKKAVARGDFLYQQGSAVKALYALRSGVAKIYDDRRNLQGIVLPGQLMGAEDLYHPHHRHSVVAATDISYCELQNGQFYEISQVTTDFTQFLVMLLSRAALEKQKFIAVLTRNEAVKKVQAFLELLWSAHKEYGLEHEQLELPVTKKELAQLLGMSLSTLLRALDALVQQDVVHIEKKTITLRQAYGRRL